MSQHVTIDITSDQKLPMLTANHCHERKASFRRKVSPWVTKNDCAAISKGMTPSQVQPNNCSLPSRSTTAQVRSASASWGPTGTVRQSCSFSGKYSQNNRVGGNACCSVPSEQWKMRKTCHKNTDWAVSSLHVWRGTSRQSSEPF